MKYDWQWSIFSQMAADGTGTWLQYLLGGLVWSLCTALAAWVIALSVGSVVGTLRTIPTQWVVKLGNAYVEIFRNIPLLVQMFLWFFVVPELLPEKIGTAIKQTPPPWGSFIPAVLCLGIYTSVRVAEQVRAGIQSLPRGQMMAGTNPQSSSGRPNVDRVDATTQSHLSERRDIAVPRGLRVRSNSFPPGETIKSSAKHEQKRTHHRRNWPPSRF